MFKEHKKKLALAIAYKQTFDSEQGKLVLHDLMSWCHMADSVFSPSNSHETAFREGERNVALRILSALNLDVQQIEKQMKETESDNADS